MIGSRGQAAENLIPAVVGHCDTNVEKAIDVAGIAARCMLGLGLNDWAHRRGISPTLLGLSYLWSSVSEKNEGGEKLRV